MPSMKPVAYWPYEVAYIRREDGTDLAEEEGQKLFDALPSRVKDNKIVVIYELEDGTQTAVLFYDYDYRQGPVEAVRPRTQFLSRPLPVPQSIL